MLDVRLPTCPATFHKSIDRRQFATLSFCTATLDNSIGPVVMGRLQLSQIGQRFRVSHQLFVHGWLLHCQDFKYP